MDDSTKEPGKSVLGTASKAALGLTAAAAAAYGMYLWGRPRGRSRPVTELPNALNLRLEYVSWRDFHYAYYSRPGVGRPVVFLHSINAVASAHENKPLIRQFQRETGRPIHAVEWIGFGHSDRPDIAYTPDLLEAQLQHFITRVISARDGVDVIGYSLGATYAAEVARRRPDLIRSLVAIEPSGLGDDPEEIGKGWSHLLFTLPGVQRAFYERMTTPEALYRFARHNLFSDEFGVPDDYVDYGVETARIEGAARPLDEFLNGRLFPRDARESFLRLRQPMLVIHGTITDRRMESYTALPEISERPNVTTVTLPTGALPHWELPGQVMDHVSSFLTELEEAQKSER